MPTGRARHDQHAAQHLVHTRLRGSWGAGGGLRARALFAHTPGEGYAKACEALAEMDLTSLAPKIKAPTLIVIGEQDLPAFHKSAKWLEQNIAGSRKVVLAPARHASILERPEEFSEAARAFLRG